MKSLVVTSGPQTTWSGPYTLVRLEGRLFTSDVLLLRCWVRSNCRRYVGKNPERGTKAGRDKVLSKRTGKVAHKKTTKVTPHVSTLLKRLMDFI